MSDEPWPTIDGRPAKPSELAEFYVDMGVRAAKRETQDEIARLTKANAELREALESILNSIENAPAPYDLDIDKMHDVARRALANSSEGE